jgi:hypothetical protein
MFPILIYLFVSSIFFTTLRSSNRLIDAYGRVLTMTGKFVQRRIDMISTDDDDDDDDFKPK